MTLNEKLEKCEKKDELTEQLLGYARRSKTAGMWIMISLIFVGLIILGVAPWEIKLLSVAFFCGGVITCVAMYYNSAMISAVAQNMQANEDTVELLKLLIKERFGNSDEN